MKRLLVGVALIVLLSGLWKTVWVNAAGEKQQQVSAPQSSGAVNASAADFVGSETCATCHADIATKFATNPHAKLALLHGGKGVTCESCHGPGKAHVEGGGDVTKIFRFTKASAKQIDARCLDLPRSDHPNFERSPHAKAGVSCTSCHSNHSFARWKRACSRFPADALLPVPQRREGDVRDAVPPPCARRRGHAAATAMTCMALSNQIT
jgi:hypothetical protein